MVYYRCLSTGGGGGGGGGGLAAMPAVYSYGEKSD